MLSDWVEIIKKLANDTMPEDAPLWGIIMLIVVFGVFGLIFDYCTHFIYRENMIEYGYGKIKHKKKRFENQTFIDKALLLSLYREAPRKGAYLVFCWVLNLFACLGFITEIIAICSSILTRCKGWTILLMILSGMDVMFFCVIIDFIPSYICLPSVREHYKK